MKRTLIALGIAATVALPVAAQAAPKVYGKINLSVEQIKVDNQAPATLDTDSTRLQSNASRFGVKGEDELTATLSAIYLIEWQVAADDGIAAGSNTDLTQRNRYLGIKSADFGTIKLGKYDSYTKTAQGEIDLFNDYEGDMQYVIAGENRLNNLIGYESPKFFDALSFNIQTQTQEATNATPAQTANKNGSSASIVYNSEELGLYVALAADDNVVGATALSGTRESDNLRFVAAYTIAGFGVNGIYQTSKSAAPITGTPAAVALINDEETGWQLGVSYKLGDETLKAQYGVAEADKATATIQERTQWSVGVDHTFTKSTKAFIWYTSKEEDKVTVNTGDIDTQVLALGLEHKF